MLVISERCRNIVAELAALLFTFAAPPPLWRWWPYYEGVASVAGNNLPTRPLDSIAGMRQSVA